MSREAPAGWKSSRAPRDAGFTLLEVMVAVAIFALTIMTLFVIRGRAVEQAHLARNIDVAQRYGKLLLEDILLGNKVYTDGDSGTFEPPEAKNLSYEVFVEEVTVAGSPPDEEEEGRRGAPTVGGRLPKSSEMDERFGSGRKSSKSGSSDDGLAADADTSGQADEGAGASASSGKKKKKKGGGGGLFGGDDEEEEPEILYRVIVKVHYPVLDKTETLTLETLVPPPPEEGDDEDAFGATDDGAGGKDKGQGGGKGGGKKKGGGGGGGKKGRKGQGAGDDLFGG